MLQRNKVNRIFFAKNWLLSGWGLYKQKPITWVFMVFLFTIAYIIAVTSIPGRAIAALLTPVFLGGIYFTAYTADKGSPISMENLFSMFKETQKLKQLLIIGGIGVAVVGLTFTFENMLGTVLFWVWGFATLFSIPLVAIQNQTAVESLKSSFIASLVNIVPLFFFYVSAFLLLILGAATFGIGLLVVLPTLFCASYFIFKTVYLEGIEQIPEKTPSTSETIDSASTITSASAADAVQGLVHNPSNVFENFLAEKVEQRIEEEADMSLPDGFLLNYFDDYMQITRKWLGAQTFGLLVGTLVFNYVWMGNGFVEIIASDRELLLKIFCLAFIAIGAVSAYFTIASAMNKTQVYVNKNSMAIQHHPIPWIGNKTIEVKEIQQIYVKTVVKTNNQRTYYKYHVLGLTSDNQKIKLVTGLTKYQHAHFIEKKIEDYLGIENESVADEQSQFT